MEINEAFALWDTKDFTISQKYFNERLKNEVKNFSDIKGELYSLAFIYDDDKLSKEEKLEAEDYVNDLNKILYNLIELVTGGKERNYSFNEVSMQVLFVENYIKGNYDNDFKNLCNFTKNKINQRSKS